MQPSRTAFGLATCALALVAGCDRAPQGGAAQSTSVAFVPEHDDRLAHLFGPCQRPGPFTADTTDLLPVLVEKLATAEADVASRARADLIAAGPAAVPELARVFGRTFTEPGQAPRLLGLLDLAALAGGEAARAMGLEGLEHPSESVRSSAARVLQLTGVPADYDRLALGVARGGEELARQCALALVACDPARVAREIVSWLDDPARARVVDLVVPHAARHLDQPTRARLLADPRVTPVARTWITAAAAAIGDAQAQRELIELLQHENSLQRQVALQAALAGGTAREAAVLVARDADPTLRVLAYEALAREPDAPERRAELAAGLADRDETVRRVALVALCGRGDAGAIDIALDLLAGSSEDVGLALAALRAPLAGDEALAQRVLARLEELLEGGGRSHVRAIERAIGQVPLARAAEILLTRGRAGGASIQGVPHHRWYAIQAGNAGHEGRAWIRAQWDTDPDPVRRLDLLSAGVQESSAAAAAFLEHVLDSPRASDPERLLAADLLARSVPAAQAAPILKRAPPSIADPALRRALDCLLWRFYGPARR